LAPITLVLGAQMAASCKCGG